MYKKGKKDFFFFIKQTASEYRRGDDDINEDIWGKL
jgi:hypothetical protein